MPRTAPHDASNDGITPRERRSLLAHAAGRAREHALTLSVEELDPVARRRFDALVDARRRGEPMAYLLGSREFYSRDFLVDGRVLIPRHETELLADDAIATIRARFATGAPDVLDLGTGSGILAITIALECPSARVVATDLSQDALDVARDNAGRLSASVEWRFGSWYDAIDVTTRFDLIVSNPPYIPIDDHHLRLGDLRFEPRSALSDGGDGMRALATIVANAPSHLRPGGRLAVEHGFEQAAATRRLFDAAGFVDVITTRDLAGLDRVTAGTWPPAL